MCDSSAVSNISSSQAIELLKLVFCSPTRAGVFDPLKVKLTDVRECLQRLVGLVARRGCFGGDDDEGGDAVAKACVVSLARQGYIGVALLASVMEDESMQGGLMFDKLCGNLLITEALIAEYGDVDDTRVDKDDIADRLKMAMQHINTNARERAAQVVRAGLVKGVFTEEELRKSMEGWSLDDKGAAYMEREFAHER